MNKSYVVLGFGVIILGVALLAGWFFTHPVAALLLKAPSCDVGKTTCTATDITGRAISLTLAPSPLPILKPIQITVSVQGMEAPEHMQFVLEGVNMFMGFQRSLLTLDPVGRLVGTVQIPSCTQHAMQWKITLLTSDAHSPLQAEFSMYTHN